jgi:hypothetical protein
LVVGSSAGKEKKELYMKMSRLSLAVLGAAFLFSTSAFAQSENKGKLSVPETITVEGKQLPPGDYKVEWDGTGPNVEDSEGKRNRRHGAGARCAGAG